MAETPVKGFYQMSESDTKRTTIGEIATTMQKIEDNFLQVDDNLLERAKKSVTGEKITSLNAFERLVLEVSDEPRINRAIAEMADKAVLVLPFDCEINNTVTITKPIHIIGYNTEMKINTNGLDRIFRFDGVDGFSVLGVKFNSNLKGRTSIEINNCKNFFIKDCYFTGYSKEFGYYQTDGGIRINDSTDGKIMGNTWENHGDQYSAATEDLNRCISIQGTTSDRIIVANNEFNKVNQAIVISCGEDIIVSGNIFNHVRDNSLYILGGVKGITITGNTFNEKYDESIVISGENVRIIGNKFKNVPNKVFAINGDVKNLIIQGNTIENDGTTELAQIIGYRVDTRTVDKMIFTGNIIKIPFKNNAYSYFDMSGDCTDFVISDNIIDVITVASQNIFYFGKNATGFMRNNKIKGTDATSVAVSGGVNTTGLVHFESNDLLTCRISTNSSFMVFKGSRFQDNVPYVNYAIKNRVMQSVSIPTDGKWKRGDIVYAETPTAGGYIGWICVVGDGTGLGTWKGFGAIQA